MPKDTKKTNLKGLLLEAANGGKTVTVNDPTLAKAVADFAAFHKLAAEAEAAEKAAREVIEAALARFEAAVLVTPSGTATVVPASRNGLDESLIPAEILEAARKTSHFVKLSVVGAE